MSTSITLRLPDELHAAVKAAADTDRRSLNGQILWMLEYALEERGTP